MALQEVELTTSGRFMCQITMDSPPFEFVEDGGRLTVISLPERFPVISGNKGQTYTLGDWVDLNCTCFETYPAASIRWFINGKEVNSYIILVLLNGQNLWARADSGNAHQEKGWHGQSRAMPIKKFGGMGIAHRAMGIKWAFA